MTIGERIKERRKDLGMTQNELAEKLGVSFQAVSKWENETSLPDTAMFPALSSVLDVSLDYLFTGAGEWGEVSEKRAKWGNLTGTITKDIHGDVGRITGDVQADIYGNVNGDIVGTARNIFGNVEGSVIGEVTGDITGYVAGNLLGVVHGSVKLGVRGKKILGTVIGDGINVETKKKRWGVTTNAYQYHK